jgi:hypothetical protein
VQWRCDHRTPLAAACWRHSCKMCCRDSKDADNSSPETTTDDSDPLDWTGSDKGNVQVCRVAVTLITIMHTVQLCSDMLLTLADILAARNRQQGDLLPSYDRLVHVLLVTPSEHTHAHAAACRAPDCMLARWS